MSGEIFVDLRDMTAREIIHFINWNTTGSIPVSPKSKKSVIAHALRILKDDGYEVRETKVEIWADDCPQRLIRGEINLKGMTAREIVNKVFECTWLGINYSLKSKRSIIRKAEEILAFEGYVVV